MVLSALDDTATNEAAVETDVFTETLARPLFRPDRRPYVPKPVVVEVPAPPPEPPRPPDPPPVTPPLPQGLALVGIVSSPEGGRRAMIRMEGTSGAQSYSEGALLGGWTLAKIESGAIALSANGETRTFELFAARAESPPEPASTPRATGEPSPQPQREQRPIPKNSR